MSTSRGRFPTATRGALALAAAVGTLALVAAAPMVVLGALAGVVLGAVVPSFDGSSRRVTVAAGLVPAGTFAAIAVVGVSGSLLGTTLAVIGLVVGIVTGTIISGNTTATAAERAGTAALYSGLVAGVLTIFAFAVAETGVWAALTSLAWITGGGEVGITLWIILAGFAVVAAILSLPPSMFAAPSRRESYLEARKSLASWLLVGAVLVILASLVLVTGVRFVFGVGPTASTLVESTGLRVVFVLLTVAGLVVAAFGLSVRPSWFETTGRENRIVPITVGAVCGAVVPFSVLFAAGVDPRVVVGPLFGGGSLVLVIGWALAWGWSEGIQTDSEPKGATTLAVALVFGGIVVGTTVDGITGLESALTGVATLVAVAAGLFAYDVDRYGRTLVGEVDWEGTAPEPQIVRIAWSALIAGVGVVVAAGGLLVATLVAPTLSVPATVAVLAGLAAVVAGAWTLSR